MLAPRIRMKKCQVTITKFLEIRWAEGNFFNFSKFFWEFWGILPLPPDPLRESHPLDPPIQIYGYVIYITVYGVDTRIRGRIFNL